MLLIIEIYVDHNTLYQENCCFKVLSILIGVITFQPNSEELEKRVEELRKKYQEARLKARGNNNNTGTGSNSPGSPSTQSRTRHSPQRWGGFIR